MNNNLHKHVTMTHFFPLFSNKRLLARFQINIEAYFYFFLLSSDENNKLD